MTIIGITGPSGSGKSLLTNYIKDLALPTIDADEVYHSLLVPPSECLDALRKAFGISIFNTDGTLNRSALSEIVFQNKDKLALLNATVLEIVLKKIRTMIEELELQGHKTVFVDAPTLIESGFHKECSIVVSVLASAQTRIERIIERDNISRQKAEARVLAQKGDSFYIENSHRVLINNSDAESFLREARELLKDIVK